MPIRALQRSVDWTHTSVFRPVSLTPRTIGEIPLLDLLLVISPHPQSQRAIGFGWRLYVDLPHMRTRNNNHQHYQLTHIRSL